MQDRIALHAPRFRLNVPGTGGLLLLRVRRIWKNALLPKIRRGKNKIPEWVPLASSAICARGLVARNEGMDG